MESILFEKGQLKTIYEFNQEIKNIFTEYRFMNKLFVVGNPISSIGRHYVNSGFQLIDDIVLSFDSRKVYELLKTGRKNMINFTFDLVKCYINNNEFCIHDFNDRDYVSLCAEVNYFEDYYLNSNNIIRLSEDDVYKLTKNQIIELGCGEFKSRISRKLIPGLKKSHDVKIKFYNEGNDDNTFRMHIKVDRKSLISNHIYRCIKY